VMHTLKADSDLGREGSQAPWSGSNGGSCIQVKQLSGQRVVVSQSTDPDGPAVISSAVAEFTNGVKAGIADFLLV